MSTLDELCANAVRQQIAGRLDEAERIYRNVLLIDGRHAAANHCFGMLTVQRCRPLEALPYLHAALEANPELPDYWLGYLEALRLAGRLDDARSILALARQRGLAGTAVEAFAAKLPPPSGAADGAPEKSSRAESCRRERVVCDQEEALSAMLKKGLFAEGLAFAVELTKNSPERALGWKTLGALHFAAGRREPAIEAMQTAIRLAPDDAEAHKNLGTMYTKLDRLEELEHSLRRALHLNPLYAAAHSHLGSTYQLQGRFSEAQACFRRAISLPAGELQDESSPVCCLR